MPESGDMPVFKDERMNELYKDLDPNKTMKRVERDDWADIDIQYLRQKWQLCHFNDHVDTLTDKYQAIWGPINQYTTARSKPGGDLYPANIFWNKHAN